MSWTHLICGECWNTRFPEKPPVEFECGVSGDSPRCCFCGEPTTTEI